MVDSHQEGEGEKIFVWTVNASGRSRCRIFRSPCDRSHRTTHRGTHENKNVRARKQRAINKKEDPDFQQLLCQRKKERVQIKMIMKLVKAPEINKGATKRKRAGEAGEKVIEINTSGMCILQFEEMAQESSW